MVSATVRSKESVNEESNNNNNKELIVRGEGEGGPNSSPAVSNLSIPDVTLLNAAISLKDQVLKVTWLERQVGSTVVDPSTYTGVLGTAFICLRSYLLTGCHQDLLSCADIIETCTVAASSMRHLTFLCGKGGVYALGAVIYHYLGDRKRRDQYLDYFHEVSREKALPMGPEEGGFGMSYDLLCGRAGFLWAALFIKSHIKELIPTLTLTLTLVVEAILAGGRAGSTVNLSCPLMYRWHGTCYYGAAHGLAGILQVLLQFPLSEEDAEDVKKALRYMMSKRFPCSGNYPSFEGNVRDTLVQWSHGATSMAITLSKASQVFTNEREFRDGAIEAGEVVWKRGLQLQVKKKAVGLADGTAGNAYAFLSLYRLTGEALYLDRAKAFASLLYHNNAKDLIIINSSSDNPFTNHQFTVRDSTAIDDTNSLFFGIGGVACLWFDLLSPHKSRFPGYEL